MILAGDVGGTKTLLGVFERAEPRPRQAQLLRYTTTAFSSFGSLLDAFLRDAGPRLRVDAVALGVAGPVVGGVARLTNFTWGVEAAAIQARLGAPVALLNDLEAMAYSVSVLTPDEMLVLQAGTPQPDGHAALIAAGTGLGQAHLHRVGGRLLPAPSESGHADFAARTDREAELVRMLRQQYGRASIEHVLSGPGLVNLHRFTHGGAACPAVAGLDVPDHPAAVTAAALAHQCARCEDALAMFVEAYGAETGNMALRAMATAGVYVGGGIVRHILPAVQSGSFLREFLAKPPMDGLLARMPLRLILNAEAGLLGAALFAQRGLL